MKENILTVILHADMTVDFKDGINRLNVHQAAQQYFCVELSGFSLAEGETLHVSFENAAYKLNPVLISRTDEGYRIPLPNEVTDTIGECAFTLYVKSDWNEETGTAASVWPSGIYTFYEHSALADAGHKVPSEYDIVTMYENAIQKDKMLFIRYSANATGLGMTKEWREGQRYIGTYLGALPSDDPADYTWAQFTGDAYCSTDSVSNGVVTYELKDDADKTFTSTEITKLRLVIPSSPAHGFFAGVNFPTGAEPPALVFMNKSTYPLKLMRRGIAVDSYQLGANKTILLVATCDGINVYINLLEV